MALEAVTVPSPEDPGPLVITGRSAFEQLSAGLVRPDHAAKAVEAHDALVSFGYQDVGMFVATKAMQPAGKAPFVVLACGVDRDGERQVTSGYRLYSEHDDVAALARDPRLAFRLFLERFALPYKAHDRWVLFVPVMTQSPSDNGNTRLIDVAETDEAVNWALNMQARANADGTATVAWPFAINFTAYKRSVRRHQS